VRGDNVDSLELLREGSKVSKSVQDIRVKKQGKELCKAGKDHDKEHKTFRS
jgi:hypothetical protein